MWIIKIYAISLSNIICTQAYLNHSEPSNLGYPIFRRNHLSARKSPASWPHPHLIIYQKASGWSYKTKGTHNFTNKCVWLIIVIKFPKINPFKKQRQHFFRLVVCSRSYYTPRKRTYSLAKWPEIGTLLQSDKVLLWGFWGPFDGHYTLQQSNMAKENQPFLDDFPRQTSISKGYWNQVSPPALTWGNCHVFLGTCRNEPTRGIPQNPLTVDDWSTCH